MIDIVALARTAWHSLFGRRRTTTFPVVLAPGSPAAFPDPTAAPAEGLIAVGGDLSAERLLAAYRGGIFPWYDDSTPILWWSPDPRAIFELDGLHVPRRLGRTLRSGRFQVTVNLAFDEVIRGCADREEGSWVTPDMIAAYETLHQLGHAHSIETWRDGRLGGGIYGVAVGGLFASQRPLDQGYPGPDRRGRGRYRRLGARRGI